MVPLAADGSGTPAAFAGLTLGAVRLAEPGAPDFLPGPGALAARRALSSSDSVAVALAGGGSWEGFGAPLAVVRGLTRAPERGHATAVVELSEGSQGFENNSLGLERRDSTRAFRLDVVTGNRGAVGPFERAGHHLWGLSTIQTRGRHRFEASYAQRGAGDQLTGGEEEEAAGESGALAYGYASPRGWTRLELTRGDLHHESAGGSFADYARRDAGESRAALELGVPWAPGTLAARLAWSEAAVTRVTGGAAVESWTTVTTWGAVRLERPLGPAAATLGVGAGHDRATGETTFAPEAALRLERGAMTGAFGIARLLAPVWSDLAPGQGAFLQSTWAGHGTLALAGRSARLRLFGVAGRAADRALFARAPLEELWLRAGAREQVGRYRFALGAAAADARWRALDVAAEGFLLGRDRDLSGPQVDPSWGARASGGGRFALFQGDLGVTLRGEVAWVGERETEEAAPRRLPATTILGASLALRIADATFTLRARNLLDRPESLTWIEPLTGRPARGEGLSVRGALNWHMAD